ncbi:MAG: 6,7-dimethyl-8-ribityllumazine synthase [Planctomycetota bacterium]
MPTEYKGKLSGAGLRIAIVVSKFNEFITDNLLKSALDELDKLGVADSDVTVAWAPGSLEMPLLAKSFCESGKADAVICLGAVIRGETDHYQHVAAGTARGIGDVARHSKVPVIFGVLTVDTLEQAINRAGAKAGNRGANSARAAIEAVSVLRQIKES